MSHKEFEPRELGQGVPIPLEGEGASLKEEHGGAGTSAVLEENIDQAIDKINNTQGWAQKQPYHVRKLVEPHGVRAVFATIIAADLAMRGLS